jgi:iron complex outermembrane receptor protein
MYVRRFVILISTLISVAALSATVIAQAGVTLTGRLVNSLSGDPIPDAAVQIDELRRQTASAADGTFTFNDVPPGSYHLSVHSSGYSSRRTEVVVAAAAVAVGDLTVDPELHFEEVVSVSAESRSQFESFQPTAVLAGQELTKQLEMSLGATLENQPGVASRSFGPAPARPVIRGLDGDRVQILQDGQRMGDLSSQSGDHGVNVNPADRSGARTGDAAVRRQRHRRPGQRDYRGHSDHAHRRIERQPHAGRRNGVKGSGRRGRHPRGQRVVRAACRRRRPALGRRRDS